MLFYSDVLWPRFQLFSFSELWPDINATKETIRHFNLETKIAVNIGPVLAKMNGLCLRAVKMGFVELLWLKQLDQVTQLQQTEREIWCEWAGDYFELYVKMGSRSIWSNRLRPERLRLTLVSSSTSLPWILVLVSRLRTYQMYCELFLEIVKSCYTSPAVFQLWLCSHAHTSYKPKLSWAT